MKRKEKGELITDFLILPEKFRELEKTFTHWNWKNTLKF